MGQLAAWVHGCHEPLANYSCACERKLRNTVDASCNSTEDGFIVKKFFTYLFMWFTKNILTINISTSTVSVMCLQSKLIVSTVADN